MLGSTLARWIAKGEMVVKPMLSTNEFGTAAVNGLCASLCLSALAVVTLTLFHAAKVASIVHLNLIPAFVAFTIP